ncbi:hypothetical protein [Georgenia yuyongxinii]
MTAIGLQPITLNNARFEVAEDDYSSSVTQVLFVPQVRYTWERFLDQRDPVPVYDSVSWTVTVGFVQDLFTPAALTRYLIEHAAQTRTVVFQPEDGGPTVQADVMIVPAQIGGTPGQPPVAAATMPLFDPPTIGPVT